MEVNSVFFSVARIMQTPVVGQYLQECIYFVPVPDVCSG